ncbi:outer membrane protein assembly factor [Thioalkalivibrio denitrificans]|uniref:Outer membrane protein assembly factor n=1 Tax=Thioalkalivibrio denitrificans TaxID=108003 RepID=A0A1V3NDB8_9GAMM|nr:outer membrane protein assembly factor [Thioalkalivibrio denitrificans]
MPLAACLWAVWSAAQAVPPPVLEIAFEGNRVTRASVLRQELLIREGDPADPGAIEASRQSLMNLGLFKDVRAETASVEGGVVLTYHLAEKYFYFVLPRLSRSADGDLRYGGEVRADNVFGLNHRLRLRFDIDEAASGTEQRDERLSLGYRVARVPGTRFGAGLDLGMGDRTKSPSGGNDSDRYRERYRYTGLSLSRWLDRRGPSRGWRLDTGVRWESRRYQALDSEAELPDAGEDVSWRVGVRFTDVADLGVRREGVEYGGGVTLGVPDLGANRDHQRFDLFYRRYRGLGGELPSNLNYQVRAGWANDTPFGQTAYSVGDSSSLRGYKRDYREGDVRLLLNMEYLRPLFGNPNVRGVLFADAGGVWPSNDVDLSDMLASAGIGLRVNLRWFVSTELRVDAAYGDEGRVYVGTSHTF